MDSIAAILPEGRAILAYVDAGRQTTKLPAALQRTVSCVESIIRLADGDSTCDHLNPVASEALALVRREFEDLEDAVRTFHRADWDAELVHLTGNLERGEHMARCWTLLAAARTAGSIYMLPELTKSLQKEEQERLVSTTVDDVCKELLRPAQITAEHSEQIAKQTGDLATAMYRELTDPSKQNVQSILNLFRIEMVDDNVALDISGRGIENTAVLPGTGAISFKEVDVNALSQDLKGLGDFASIASFKTLPSFAGWARVASMGRSFRTSPIPSPTRSHSTSGPDILGAWARMQLDERDALEILRSFKALVAVKGSDELIKSKRVAADQIMSMTRLHVKRPTMTMTGCSELAQNLTLALVRVLPGCVMLREVSLEALCMSDTSVGHLASALTNCKRLERLDLGSNKIGDEGATALTRVLCGCPRMKLLQLDRNRLTDAGALYMYEQLTQVVPKQQLKLVVDGNKLTRACKKDLKDRHDSQGILAAVKL